MALSRFCLVSNQGTATCETGLCESCFGCEENKEHAREQGRLAGDIPDLNLREAEAKPTRVHHASSTSRAACAPAKAGSSWDA